MQMNILIDCGLDTSYFLEFPPRDIIGSKAQQHASVSVEVSSNISDHSDHTSSSNDAILENKENDKKRRKLDHLIDSTGDGSGGAGGGVRRRGQFLVETPEFSSIDWNIIDFIFITNYNHMLALPYITEYTNFKGKIYATEPTVLFGRQMMKELVHFFGDSVLKSRTHSQPGSTNIFTGVTADWNVARSLYSIADIQSCIDKVRPVRFGEHLNLYELEVTAYSSGYCLGSANWMIDCGGEKISIVSSSSTVQNIHPLPFDETVLNNADVIILSDLRDKDGARFETILIEIGNCVANTLKNKGNVLFPCTMNGIIFDIIGFLSQHLRAVGLRGIPFYAVSPIAEESLKYSNICGEWMCTERQQKMYLPDNPMHHQDMIEQSLLYYASRADSSLQEKYQEPCVVFAGHPSLRSGAAINFIRKWGNNSNNSIIFTESEYDCEEAMSAFEGLQIKSIYLPIDIRLTIKEDYYDRKSCFNIELVNLGKDSLIASLNGTLNIHNTKTSLTSAENQLNQQRYVCGEFDVSKLINELTEQIYGCRIDEFEEDKRNSSYKISLISPKATIYLNNENFKIITTDNQTRIKLTKILIKQLIVL
ncbi:hypothetical protein RhiirC2_849720 [Rhizophagus irregularis]|uniref:Beta-Casp domain-containing protein n=1 Tax=Rhizophagus irregularis TaxID=588596 RepID=A0A2N1N9X2_9GLOM|nr:hypothetical protein RhiirC2_849720 [Rhizophagus irregularis]